MKQFLLLAFLFSVNSYARFESYICIKNCMGMIFNPDAGEFNIIPMDAATKRVGLTIQFGGVYKSDLIITPYVVPLAFKASLTHGYPNIYVYNRFGSHKKRLAIFYPTVVFILKPNIPAVS